jgi:hypothetical protein
VQSPDNTILTNKKSFNLIFPTITCGKFYYSNWTDEKAEAERG